MLKFEQSRFCPFLQRSLYSLSFSVSLSRADADPKPSPHCDSLHKSLHLCTSTRDGRYSIKAFPVWWLWPSPFYAKPFVINGGPIVLTLSQHECVLITSLTVPHTFFSYLALWPLFALPAPFSGSERSGLN